MTPQEHLEAMLDWTEGRKSAMNWMPDPAQCAVYDAMQAFSHGIAAVVLTLVSESRARG